MNENFDIPLPPTGPDLTCKGWHQEAALRCLLNNLHPEVAEDRDNLIVYGGNGQRREIKQPSNIIQSLKIWKIMRHCLFKVENLSLFSIKRIRT